MPEETSPLLQDAPSNGTTYTASLNENGRGGTGNEYVEAGSIEQQGPPKRSHLTFVIPMAVGIFLTALDGTIIVSTYAAIGSELNQLQNTSWIATAYLLTLTSFQPLYGKLSDIFGRKSCLLFAYSIFALGCLLCGLARNMTELIAARAFAGIGGGGMQTIVSIIMSDVVPLRSRGTWQGVLNIVFATGNTVGASLGGFLADTIGWRWAFLLQVPLALTAIISVYFALHLPAPKETATSSDFSTKLRRIDFGGALTLVLSIFFLLFGLERGGDKSWSDKITITSLCLFLAFFVCFSVIEMEWASEPFAPKRIIANRSLFFSYLVNLFGIAGGFSILFHASLYFQAVEGKTASETGLWLIISVIGGLMGSLGGGLVMQATGKYWALTVSAYGLMVVGSLVVALLTGVLARSALGIGIGLLLTSLGNGTGITTSLISLIANAGQADQAIATAVSYLFRSLGSVIGLSIGSTLVQGSLRTSLREKLTGRDVDEIVRRVRESLSYVDTLDPATRVIVRSSYEHAIHVTFWFSVLMSSLAFLSSIFIREKPLSTHAAVEPEDE